MRRQLCCSVIALLGFVATATAQKAPAKQAPQSGPMQMGAAGTWNGQSLVGPKDSVVTTYVLTIAPDGKSATMTFPGRTPIPVRILATGGDSIVTQAGPYPSVLRAGQTVDSLRTVGHYKGDTMTGTFAAYYAGGDVLKGKTKATRAK